MATVPTNPTQDATLVAAGIQASYWGYNVAPANAALPKTDKLTAYLSNSTSAQSGADFVVKDVATAKLAAASAIVSGCVGTVEWKDPDTLAYTAVGTLDNTVTARTITVPGTYRVRTAAFAGLAYGVQLGN